MNYMRMYYSDDSFDNDHIDGNIKTFWDDEKKSRLTPLRKWELKGSYSLAKSAKLSKTELNKIIMSSIPTIIMFTVFMAISGSDMTFYQVI